MKNGYEFDATGKDEGGKLTQEKISLPETKGRLTKLASMAAALLVLLSAENNSKTESPDDYMTNDEDQITHVEKATIATYEDVVNSVGISVEEDIKELKRLMDRNRLLLEADPKETYEHVEAEADALALELDKITEKTLDNLQKQKEKIEKEMEDFREFNRKLASISERVAV